MLANAVEGALAELPPAEIARRLAYVPQAHVTEFSFTVLDVVLMGRTARLKAYATPGPADERGPGGIRGHGSSLLSGRAIWRTGAMARVANQRALQAGARLRPHN